MSTILIVDDRETNREFLLTLLGYEGHRLLQARDGAEALDVVLHEHCHLVITDVLMPSMDGYEFVRRLRAEPAIASTKVMFYTAHYPEEQAKPGCSLRRTRVLTKPCEPEEVLRTVNSLLFSPVTDSAAPTTAQNSMGNICGSSPTKSRRRSIRSGSPVNASPYSSRSICSSRRSVIRAVWSRDSAAAHESSSALDMRLLAQAKIPTFKPVILQ